MNERGITRVSNDQLAEMIDETDWARVAAMTEADIERVAAEDRGASLTAAGDWTDARVVWPRTTEPVTLRLGQSRLEKPDLTLRAVVAELAERDTPASYGAVWRFFKREGISFKKKPVRQ